MFSCFLLTDIKQNHFGGKRRGSNTGGVVGGFGFCCCIYHISLSAKTSLALVALPENCLEIKYLILKFDSPPGFLKRIRGIPWTMEICYLLIQVCSDDH